MNQKFKPIRWHPSVQVIHAINKYENENIKIFLAYYSVQAFNLFNPFEELALHMAYEPEI